MKFIERQAQKSMHPLGNPRSSHRSKRFGQQVWNPVNSQTDGPSLGGSQAPHTEYYDRKFPKRKKTETTLPQNA
jgi:hypothetical protein